MDKNKVKKKGIGMKKGLTRVIIGILLALSVVFIIPDKDNGAYAKWKTNQNGTWWEESDGSYPVNEWKKISEEWYYFDYLGYRVTGWQKIKSQWYYFDTDGKMAVGWREIDGKWYYFTIGNGTEHPHGSWIDNNTCEKGTIKGIDVSRWQGDIDWKRVKADGVQFAFTRIGAYDFSLDSKYKANVKGANSVGIPIGVYYYSTARTVEEARAQAQFVIYSLQGYTISYPVVIDLEDDSISDLSRQELADIAKAFCDEVEAAGYIPMLYCNENWIKNYIDRSRLDGIEMWIAAYCNVYNTNISRDIWQSCSTGRVDGIDGDVDIDFAYKDYSKLYTPRTYAKSGYFIPEGSLVDVDGRWKYGYFDGGYAKSSWKYVFDAWYWFDGEGYAVTGWKLIDGKWYWFNQSGKAADGWRRIGGQWYYFNKSCDMSTGWEKIGADWYYFGSNGVMRADTYIDGYYVDADGRYQIRTARWVRNSSGWWYQNADGTYPANRWKMIDGKWYWFGRYGYAVTGWRQIDGIWYWFNSDCAMVTGWQRINYRWYYFNASGELLTNRYIDGYYVDANGAWIE